MVYIYAHDIYVYIQGNNCYYGTRFTNFMFINTRLERLQYYTKNKGKFKTFLNLSPEINTATGRLMLPF